MPNLLLTNMSHSKREQHAAGQTSQGKVIEKGHVYFLYRPKVGVEGDVKNMVDVQKLIMILSPHDTGHNHRMLLLPKKKLPKIDTHQRHMAIIDVVSKNIDDLSDALKASSYRTKTRGTHSIPPARLLGRGSYLISYHDQDDTARFLYVLDHPSEITSVQKAFNIEQSGHFIIVLKNADLLQHGISNEIIDKYEGKNFIPVLNSHLLDIEKSQIVMIGGSKDIKKEKGGEDIIEKSRLESDEDVREMFKELHLSRTENPSDPLEGKLV